MRLYHSSNMIVECPDLNHSRKYLDFGFHEVGRTMLKVAPINLQNVYANLWVQIGMVKDRRNLFE